MIDFLRSNHAQLLSVFTILIVWVILFLVVKKHIPEEYKSLSRKIFGGVIGFVLIVYLFFALKFVSVNNTPRGTLNQTIKSDREQYMVREANKTIEQSKKDSINN